MTGTVLGSAGEVLWAGRADAESIASTTALDRVILSRIVIRIPTG
jgi:hypothetical protein